MDHSKDDGTVASLQAENETLRSHIASLESQLAERESKEEHDAQMEEYLQEVRQVHECAVADLEAKSAQLSKALEASQKAGEERRPQLNTAFKLAELCVVGLGDEGKQMVFDDLMQPFLTAVRSGELTLPKNLADVLVGHDVDSFFQRMVRPLPCLKGVNWLDPLELYQRYHDKKEFSADTYAFLIRMNPTTTLYLTEETRFTYYNSHFFNFFKEVVSALPRLETIEGPHRLVLSYLLYHEAQPQRWESVLAEYIKKEDSLTLLWEQSQLFLDAGASSKEFLSSVFAALPSRVNILLQDNSYSPPFEWCGVSQKTVRSIFYRFKSTVYSTDEEKLKREICLLWDTLSGSESRCACSECVASNRLHYPGDKVFTVSAPIKNILTSSNSVIATTRN